MKEEEGRRRKDVHMKLKRKREREEYKEIQKRTKEMLNDRGKYIVTCIARQQTDKRTQ
jgi:hypothetical protein